MKYELKYKLPGDWFWKKVKGVVGDMVMEENGNRVIFLEDNSRIEIPKEAVIFFSKDRFYSIKEQMSEEAGQEIQVK